jgi:tetratricopeptide (TPR) repeat protein
MLEIARFALQRSPRRRTGPGVGLLVLCSIAGAPAVAQQSPPSCEPSVARVVAIQGSVAVQRAGGGDWLQLKRLEASLCSGDRLRTGSSSRAALFLEPETLVRVDQNTTITLSVTTAEILVEFFADNVDQAARDAHSCGAGYFITRFPRKFRVSGPHLNAAVEGTEFQVAVQCDATELAVLEGAVRSETVAAREERTLTAGERLVAGPTGPAAFSTLIKPTDAVQWVLYYPPLSDAKAEAEIPGRDQCRALPAPSDQACLSQRAEVLLRVGRIDEALQDVDEVLRVNPASGDANALRAIIQIAKNDKGAALESANAATGSSPNSIRAWLALSYAQQASFQLEQALESAKQAQGLDPNSSLVNARVAELLMSLGLIDEAEAAARAGVAANPAESGAHTMLGFVHLAQIDTQQARADFQAAIESDSFNPLARLGLGLAKIRDGALVEGRRELEIAVALDPSNSLLRSYVGKAYYEENTRERDGLAATQFGVAKQLDELDPTPCFYEAILKQTQNRPAEALQELECATEKNDNRAVYRSRLMLADDAAAQGASIAAIYDDLGFEKLAIVESTKALAENAGNHSAHRELATAYANVPRHDIARVSEALQAQIRQPISVSPVDPLLATDSVLILRDAGPSQLGANEFSRLFNKNEVLFSIEGIVGDRDTLGHQAVLSGLTNRVSFALSELHYETDGFIDNDAAERTVYDAFVQGQISSAASVQLDVQRSELEVGQTFFAFDPLAEQDEISEEADSVRLSGHYIVDPGTDWILSTAYEDRFRSVTFVPEDAVFTTTDASTWSLEIQNLHRFGSAQIITGAGYIEEDDDFEFEQASIVSEAANLYAYGQWKLAQYHLNILAGFAAEWFELTNSLFPNAIERNRLSPKLGIVWSPTSGTTLRAAAFSSVRRPFIRSQTIEPTQVAGFNQFFTGFEQFFGDRRGTISERVGIALDQVLPAGAATGVEVAKRRLDVPSLIADRDFTWDETTAHLYLYKTLLLDSVQSSLSGWQAAMYVEGEYEKVERPQTLTGPEGIMELTTIRVPIGVRVFGPGGIIVRLATTYVDQEGTFSVDDMLDVVAKEDDAWITDLSAEYRLPRRLGSIVVGVNNLADDFIDLLEIDPLNPRVATRRLAFAKLRLEF